MGFWKGAQHVLTLGGSYRKERALDRLSREEHIYLALFEQIDSQNRRIVASYERLKLRFKRTKRTLRSARKILLPSCVSGQTHKVMPVPPAHLATPTPASLSLPTSGQLESGYPHALICPVVGTAASIVAWNSVQIFGTASTGTAIGGLSGAASSNAGWAAFGGGSLATGGGGMALGHIILPGIGLAVCVGFFAIQSHSKANRLNERANLFAAANSKNRSVLSTISGQVGPLESAERIFDSEDDRLRGSLQDCRRLLFRFGWLSEIYRYIRFRISGFITHGKNS
jgi:hypothetical protein